MHIVPGCPASERVFHCLAPSAGLRFSVQSIMRASPRSDPIPGRVVVLGGGHTLHRVVDPRSGPVNTGRCRRATAIVRRTVEAPIQRHDPRGYAGLGPVRRESFGSTRQVCARSATLDCLQIAAP